MLVFFFLFFCKLLKIEDRREIVQFIEKHLRIDKKILNEP